MRYRIFSLLVVSFFLSLSVYGFKIDTLANNNIIYQFELHQEIGPAATRTTVKAIEKAEKIGASYIILDLNTYGGLVSDADEIRSALIETKITTIVFIRNNAASAGALISIACDSIYMKEGATIGAAAVVNEEGEIMPEKYQSYMRGKMRVTAESTNRNPDIAEGMVDPRIEIKGVTEKDEIITFSVSEAIKNGYCQAKVKDIDDLLKVAKIDSYQLKKYEISQIESIIAFFVDPAVAGVLLMLIIGGIYYELQSPGLGFPIAASIVASVLYFTPHYLEGLAANWEILLFLVGVILMALEVFVVPGFGITGISGLIIMTSSLVLSLVRNINGFDFSFVPKHEMGVAFLTVAVVLISGIFTFFFGGQQIMQYAFSNSKIGNSTSLDKKDKFIDKINNYIGKEGISMTDLRPSGKIKIDGEWFDAMSDGEYISINTKITVINISNSSLVVQILS